MKSSVALCDIRQICRLNLDGQSVIPAVLTALHGWVPSRMNLFQWVNESCQPSNLYLDAPTAIETGELYLDEFSDGRKHEAIPSLAEILRNSWKAENSLCDGPQLSRSSLYDPVYRPCPVHHHLRVPVRERDRPLGMLMLFRSRNDRPFSTQDEDRAAQVAPYIARALVAKPVPATSFIDDGNNGLIVIDVQGTIQHMSPRGRHLLYLAAHPRVVPGKTGNPLDSPVWRGLRHLAQALVGNARGEAVRPPVLPHENAWGKFLFHAHWLQPADAGTLDLIGVTVQHLVAMPIVLMQAMAKFPLSPKQKELCLLLGAGLPYNEIARRMGISPTTVTDYVGVIFAKLDVHSRDELLRKLLNSLREPGFSAPAW
jgi:DNA-binding CsgD family transcriptional regulator